MGPHEQLAVVQIGDRHPAKGAKGHHSQKDAAPEVVALGKLAGDQGLALLRGAGPGFLDLNAEIQGPAAHAKQAPLHQGMGEIEAEGKRGQHGWQAKAQARLGAGGPLSTFTSGRSRA